MNVYKNMSNLYKTERTCECGYKTSHRGNWHTHRTRHCKLRPSKESSEKERITQLEKQLEVKDHQLKAKDQQLEAKDQQLAARDEQIKELIKRPRTVHNNTTNNNNQRITVEQNINAFGHESVAHISAEQIQTLLADPSNAVPEFIKLKHRKAPGGVNQNLRVPNLKRAIYQVVVQSEGDEKEWENRTKGEVLEQLYDDNSGHLEAEADEDTRVGSRFLMYQDKVKASAAGEDGGKRYKEQLDKIHCVVST